MHRWLLQDLEEPHKIYASFDIANILVFVAVGGTLVLTGVGSWLLARSIAIVSLAQTQSRAVKPDRMFAHRKFSKDIGLGSKRSSRYIWQFTQDTKSFMPASRPLHFQSTQSFLSHRYSDKA